MTLFPHNQQAYEAVMKHFGEGNRKAAVIQPCGTGKSYMGGAVASQFEKVLVVAPNEYVYSQAIVIQVRYPPLQEETILCNGSKELSQDKS